MQLGPHLAVRECCDASLAIANFKKEIAIYLLPPPLPPSQKGLSPYIFSPAKASNQKSGAVNILCMHKLLAAWSADTNVPAAWPAGTNVPDCFGTNVLAFCWSF